MELLSPLQKLKVPGFNPVEMISRSAIEGVACLRVQRISDQALFIVKILDLKRCQPREIGQLKNEFQISRSFNLASSIKAISLESLDGKLVLVKENFDGLPLKSAFPGPVKLSKFLPLAIQISQCVAEIHQQNMIHKNLSLESIFVNSSTGEVKIDCFGIASQLPREKMGIKPVDFDESSLPFLSPEQTGRINRLIDDRSDLYSLGVIFYTPQD